MLRFTGLGRWLICFWLVSHPFPAGGVEVKDLDKLRADYGVASFESAAGYGERLKKLKVAVIDNGFGRADDLAQELPSSVFTLVGKYDKALIEKYGLGSYDEQQPLDPTDEHGRRMAMIVWGLAGYRPDPAPRIYLLNGHGLTNVARAVRYAIENKIDVILYSQNWEYAGNFDGRGFINRIVSQATAAGILWVNAAGNYRGRVYNGPVTGTAGGWVPIGPGGGGLRFKSELDRNPVKVILSWNRNNEEETQGTDRNLDLYVYDENESIVMKSELIQVVGGPGKRPGKGESFIPREIVEGEVSRNRTGYYRVRVAMRTGNFDATDRLRVTVLGSKGPIAFPDATEGSEIMVPGDHPDVVTVGDKTPLSARGPTADGRAKPEVTAPQSKVEFTDGEVTVGTSNAAACVAGLLTVAAAARGKLTRGDAIALVNAIAPQTSEPAPAAPTGQPAAPGAPTGQPAPSGVEALRVAHAKIVETVDRVLGAGHIVAARVGGDGAHLAYLDRSVLTLLAALRIWVPPDFEPALHEIYLTEEYDAVSGETGIAVYWRPIDRPPGGLAGWEEALLVRPQSFVRVMRLPR